MMSKRAVQVMYIRKYKYNKRMKIIVRETTSPQSSRLEIALCAHDSLTDTHDSDSSKEAVLDDFGRFPAHALDCLRPHAVNND